MRWILKAATQREIALLPKAAAANDQFQERASKDLEPLGIRYLAPLYARNTGLEGESIDFISNTYTLEHVPEAGISEMFRRRSNE